MAKDIGCIRLTCQLWMPNNNNILKNKQTDGLVFFERKWFKLLFLFGLYGGLFGLFYHPTPTYLNADRLTQINATVDAGWSHEHGLIKISFRTMEHQSRFGFNSDALHGRYEKVQAALEDRSPITIKIDNYYTDSLMNTTSIIPVYYLATEKSGVIFTEADFIEAGDSSNETFLAVITVLSAVCLVGIILKR